MRSLQVGDRVRVRNHDGVGIIHKIDDQSKPVWYVIVWPTDDPEMPKVETVYRLALEPVTEEFSEAG